MTLRQITTKVPMHQRSHLVSMSNMLDRGLSGTRNCVAGRPTNINSTADILFTQSDRTGEAQLP